MGNVSPSGSIRSSQWQLEAHSEHEGSINCMALSEDQSVLGTGSDDKTVRLWTTATDRTQCLGVLRGHHKYVTCISFQGGYILSGSADKTIKKWDMGKGECLFTYEGHTGMINRLIATGDFIFSSSYDATVRCWVLDSDPDYDPCLRIFRGHTKGVWPLIYIPVKEKEEDQDEDEDEDDQMDLLITGSGDGTARSWSVETGKGSPLNYLTMFRGHQGPVLTMGLNTERTILFTGSADATVRSWNIARGEVINVFQGHRQPITALYITEKFLYTGSADRTARSWVIQFGDLSRTFKGHKHSVSCIVSVGGLLFTGSGDGLVRCFEGKSGLVKRLFKGHEFTVNCMKIAHGKLFTGSFDQSLRIWSLVDLLDDSIEAIQTHGSP